MHPFGGIPICPRCEKAVYAAEQIMGPGRMLYHKPCLSCMSCNKRLDSLSLMEHDREPYCKQCYNKFFGPRDLRQANLPHRGDGPMPLSPSPIRTTFNIPQSPVSPSKMSRARTTSPSRGERDLTTLMERSRSRQSERTDSPDPNLDRDVRIGVEKENETSRLDTGKKQTSEDQEEEKERKFGGIPRTIPLNLNNVGRSNPLVSPNARAPTRFTVGTPSSSSRPLSPTYTGSFQTSPIRPTATGTRYGAALSGNLGSSSGGPGMPLSPLSPKSTGNSSWMSRAMPGTGTPLCARCQKPVYFAEQVKAVGKTFHKPCLRCSECNTALDSTRLTEKDGNIVCRSCYSKKYGPQGSGYALLGKAGA